MTRDMDLVRKILLAMADHEHGFAPEPFTIAGYDQEVVEHHIWLMEQGGIVTASEVTSQGDPGPIALPRSITWHGHDFLDTVRNEGVWLKVKALLKERALSLPFAVLQELAIQIARSRLLGFDG